MKTNNITSITRHQWVRHLLLHRLVQLGYCDGVIKPCCQHATKLLMAGHTAAYALCHSIEYAETLDATVPTFGRFTLTPLPQPDGPTAA